MKVTDTIKEQNHFANRNPVIDTLSRTYVAANRSSVDAISRLHSKLTNQHIKTI